jgi:proteasome lid subunit RPN8/RPN11
MYTQSESDLRRLGNAIFFKAKDEDRPMTPAETAEYDRLHADADRARKNGGKLPTEEQVQAKRADRERRHEAAMRELQEAAGDHSHSAPIARLSDQQLNALVHSPQYADDFRHFLARD